MKGQNTHLWTDSIQECTGYGIAILIHISVNREQCLSISSKMQHQSKWTSLKQSIMLKYLGILITAEERYIRDANVK